MPMQLHGAATDPRDPGKEQQARWMIDRKDAAEGLETFIEAPRAGNHVLELTVGSGKRVGRARIGFVTVDLEREAEQRQQKGG
jgi:hypothetical protein